MQTELSKNMQPFVCSDCLKSLEYLWRFFKHFTENIQPSHPVENVETMYVYIFVFTQKMSDKELSNTSNNMQPFVCGDCLK